VIITVTTQLYIQCCIPVTAQCDSLPPYRRYNSPHSCCRAVCVLPLIACLLLYPQSVLYTECYGLITGQVRLDWREAGVERP
jgi:hypothetical protein